MKQILIFFIFFLFISFPVLAIIIGSNTTPSRQALVTFPAADGDNEMRGFAAFEDGFALEDNTTTCLYNSFFPVSGIVTFNSGTLNLNRSLIFTNTTQLNDGGAINGNQYKVALPDRVAQFSFGGPMIFNDLDLILHSDLALNGLTTFQSNCIVEGNGYTIDFSSGSVAVDNGASVLFKNVTFSGISAGKIFCNNSSSVLSLQDVIWIQDSDYTFTQGTIEIFGSVKMTGGDFGFGYESDQVSMIKQDATWFFDSDMTFSYVPPTAASNLIAFADKTSALHLYETTLHATTTGIEFTNGTVIVEGTCPVDSQATVEAEGIRLGDGTVANDIDLKVLAESGFRVDSGYLIQKIVGS